MGLDWRDTLRTLLPQFESFASSSPGLNHLFVECADTERDKMRGPTWFNAFSSNIPVVDGRPRYQKWDCCASRGLPWVSPGFREPEPGETFDATDPSGVVRDGSGVVRAVSVPLKLRQGYFCGRPSEDLVRFDALANAAAAALTAVGNFQEHVFGSDIAAIFRKPHGGVRYIFGEVPSIPNEFIAHGWAAGVLVFESGVLIDVPLSEGKPDANHWILLLHRLGWRHVQGSGLSAECKAWNDKVEVALNMPTGEWPPYPSELLAQFGDISKESFYSVLGTKDAPLDVTLASAFAIQLLLSDLSPGASANSQAEQQIDYSNEKWKLLEIPQLRAVTYHAVKDRCKPKVAVLVATEVERVAVLKKMRPLKRRRKVLRVHLDSNTCFIGRLGGTDILLCMTAMGSSGRDASTTVTGEIIQAWKVSAVIMVGIAFGKDASKQQIGTVLVSDRIIPYEPERVGTNVSENRGSETPAGAVLLNRFRNVLGWSFAAPDGRQCSSQIGPILSGEKLIDNSDAKQTLFAKFPIAIGGEMEGTGVAAAASRRGCEWVVVKAICDWGDGNKSNQHQEFAAASSVSLVEHVLSQPGALDALS